MARAVLAAAVLLLCAGSALGKVYFKEEFKCERLG